MKNEVGIFLPIGKDIFNDKIKLEAIEKYVDSFWVRDIPIASCIDNDFGTWYDPYMYILKLSYKLKNSKISLGIAAINSSVRDSVLTVKELLTLQCFVKNNLCFAFGTSDKECLLELYNMNDIDKKNEKLISFYNFIYRSIINSEECVNNMIYGAPKNMKKPKFILASSNINIWEKVLLTEEWMTRFLSPKVFIEKYKELKCYNSNLKVTMLFNIFIVSEDSFKIDEYNGVKCIFISENNLYDFFKLYKDIGVNKFLISIPSDINYIDDIKKISNIIHNL